MKDLWAVQSISSCRKYPKSLSGVRDLINFVGSMEEEPRCQDLHLQLFLFQCSHFFKRTYVDKNTDLIRTSVGAPLIPIHSLHAGFALFLAGSLRWGRTTMHSMGRSIRFMAASTPSSSLSRTGKISYLCDFLEIRRNYEIIHQHICYFSKFFVDLFRDC